MTAAGAACCSPKCYAKAWRQRQNQNTPVITDELALKRREKWRKAELAAALESSDELAELVAEQERDERTGDYVGRGTISLDALVLADGAERYELFASADLDPSAIVIQDEWRRTLNEAVGGITEEQAQRLDFHTQEWLCHKLREEGLVGAISVRQAERERLRVAARHTGGSVTATKGWGGHVKRREKVLAQRHSRPSRKPRKRWSRWQEEMDAA